MEARHALRHVQELRQRVPFMRALRPGNSSYLLWIGDVAEFANTTWGIGASQPLRLAAALKAQAEAPEAEDAGATYRARVEAVDWVLAEYERELGAGEL